MRANIPLCEPVSGADKRQAISREVERQPQRDRAISRTRYRFLVAQDVLFEIMIRTLFGIAYGALGAIASAPIALVVGIICGIIFGSIEAFTKAGAIVVIGGGVLGFICGACSDADP